MSILIKKNAYLKFNIDYTVYFMLFSNPKLNPYRMLKSSKYLLIPLLIVQFFFSCEKEEFNTSVNASLVFSVDTILFDTVFTSIGSATQRFTVKNPYNKNLNISSIYLAGGESSPYRLNIDGYPAVRLENIELREKDS
ncbi:MAG: hypothetical protein KAQ75_04785, partial [Bacteroidales bacterium]|nr:hypothetical protein [Bacteroidales bacterium]